jgi:hypothetical protein
VTLLLSGWGSDKPHLLSAYLDEFERRSTTPFDRATFDTAAAYCEILKALWFLGWSPSHGYDEPFLEIWLEKIERSWQALGASVG